MAVTKDESKANIKYLKDQGVTSDFLKGYGSKINAGEAKTILDKYNKSRTHTIPNGMLPASMQNLTVYNLPDEAFKQLTPQLVPGTPEYQAAMDKLSTAYFDVLQQQINASTQQEQEAANYNWQNLKNTLETNLNVSLSDDAFQAWDQVQSMRNQYNQQGIEGSGIQNEAIDAYLAKARRSDAAIRSDGQTKEDASMQDYYTKFATPEQIKALVASDPEKAKGWGLLPSDEIRNNMSAAALKAKYPTMSDADIQKNIASVLDENGNYRSSLYQKYMVGSNLGANQGNLGEVVPDQYGNPIVKTVKPSDTGVLDIQAAKEQYQALNTPLKAQSANYSALVKLGAIQPTSGAESGTSSGTQFDKNTPDLSVGSIPSGTTSSLTNPIPQKVDRGGLSQREYDAKYGTGASSGGSSSSTSGRGGLSKREYKAQQSGGSLNYKTGKIKLPGSL
jgi:hypothetical protein